MNAFCNAHGLRSLTEAKDKNNHLFSEYIEESLNVDSSLCYMALEALVRAIEDDDSVYGSGSEGMLDIRLLGAVESVSKLRELIRDGSFALEAFYTRVGLSGEMIYLTHYNRLVKRTWSTHHWAIESSKGWIVLDFNVPSVTEKLT